MTREAKIGMLTGLGVIVLIGVLLSEYLGDARANSANTSMTTAPTGRMAALPVGNEYRQQVMQSVGVPAMTSTDASIPAPPPVVANVDGIAPAAFAAEVTPDPAAAAPSGPMIADPVLPVTIGRAPVETASGGPPTFEVKDTRGTPVIADVDLAVAPRAAAASYTIAPKDTLAGIAKKFYNSSKNSDVQRIIAANPGTLKDVNSTLMVGKKLVIPAAVSTPKPTAPVVAKSDGTKKTDVTRKTDVAKDALKASRTYVVQSGDTLSSIAHKLAPSHSGELVQKMISANGIRNPSSLQAGTKLKVPSLG